MLVQSPKLARMRGSLHGVRDTYRRAILLLLAAIVHDSFENKIFAIAGRRIRSLPQFVRLVVGIECLAQLPNIGPQTNACSHWSHSRRSEEEQS